MLMAKTFPNNVIALHLPTHIYHPTNLSLTAPYILIHHVSPLTPVPRTAEYLSIRYPPPQ